MGEGSWTYEKKSNYFQKVVTLKRKAIKKKNERRIETDERFPDRIEDTEIEIRRVA